MSAGVRSRGRGAAPRPAGPDARRGAIGSSRAARELTDAVLAWEGMTTRRRGGETEARLGRHSLGRLPRHVGGADVARVVAAFRERYDRAADDVDRRAGVH